MKNRERYTRILKKLFDYEYSEEELHQLLEKLGSEKEQEAFFAEAEQLWKASAKSENQVPVDTEKILKRILNKIQQAENHSEIPIPIIRSITQNHQVQQFLKIAAVLVIAVLLFVGGYSVLHHPKQNTLAYLNVKVPRGMKEKVVLPDNTSVWLNAESTLKYPQHFGKTRTVYLSGEAYFEVTKDAKHPFIVSTPEMKVKVLGTGFDVSAYPGDKQIKTTLVHGRVMAFHVNSNGDIENKVILSPGEQSIFSVTTKTFAVKKVNTTNYTAWKDGYLIFEDSPLTEVIKKIDRWYNVKMLVNDKVVEQFNYTVEFDNDSLSAVLKVLGEMTPVRFTQSGKNIFITRDKKRWNDFVNIKK